MTVKELKKILIKLLEDDSFNTETFSKPGFEHVLLIAGENEDEVFTIKIEKVYTDRAFLN